MDQRWNPPPPSLSVSPLRFYSSLARTSWQPGPHPHVMIWHPQVLRSSSSHILMFSWSPAAPSGFCRVVFLQADLVLVLLCWFQLVLLHKPSTPVYTHHVPLLSSTSLGRVPVSTTKGTKIRVSGFSAPEESWRGPGWTLKCVFIGLNMSPFLWCLDDQPDLLPHSTYHKHTNTRTHACFRCQRIIRGYSDLCHTGSLWSSDARWARIESSGIRLKRNIWVSSRAPCSRSTTPNWRLFSKDTEKG